LASFVLAPSGYPDEAVVQSEKAIALSPNYPAVYLGTLGNAYRLSGRTEKAIAAFNAYHARSPGFGLTDIVIAYQETGQPGGSKANGRAVNGGTSEFHDRRMAQDPVHSPRHGTGRGRYRSPSRRRAADGLRRFWQRSECRRLGHLADLGRCPA